MSNVDCRIGVVDRRTPRRAFVDVRRSTLDVRPPAFTLIELLVVIGIIGVVVALGVPLFGVLTGSRSQEAGQNLVAAAIGQARTIAVNEGKYAGILFYVDPATERTAMSLVVIADPQSGLEDPDPYDKYKTWTTSAAGIQYRAPGYNTLNGAPIYGDRVIGLASDASATFRAETTGTTNIYTPTTSTVYSRLAEYLGNMKPTVRLYRAKKDSLANTSALTISPSATGVRPAENGPLQNQLYFRRIPPTASPLPAGSAGTTPTVADGNGFKDSVSGRFETPYWTQDAVREISPYSTGEQQLLPIGVGVQLIIQPTLRADDVSTATPERYVRTGVIMFDPQGRLTLDTRALGATTVIGKYLGLAADINTLTAGVGVVLYDRVAFKADPTRTDADWISQNVAGAGTTQINAANTNPLLNDNASTTRANEVTEETWLDANTTPLLINRFSGALSEGQ